MVLTDDHFFDLEENTFQVIGIGARIRAGQCPAVPAGAGRGEAGAGRRGLGGVPFVHGLSLAASAWNRDLKRGHSAVANDGRTVTGNREEWVPGKDGFSFRRAQAAGPRGARER